MRAQLWGPGARRRRARGEERGHAGRVPACAASMSGDQSSPSAASGSAPAPKSWRATPRSRIDGEHERRPARVVAVVHERDASQRVRARAPTSCSAKDRVDECGTTAPYGREQRREAFGILDGVLEPAQLDHAACQVVRARQHGVEEHARRALRDGEHRRTEDRQPESRRGAEYAALGEHVGDPVDEDAEAHDQVNLFLQVVRPHDGPGEPVAVVEDLDLGADGIHICRHGGERQRCVCVSRRSLTGGCALVARARAKKIERARSAEYARSSTHRKVSRCL